MRQRIETTRGFARTRAVGAMATGVVAAAALGGPPKPVYETVVPGYYLASGRDAAVDADGNAYVTAVYHEDFDYRVYHGLVFKLDPDGNLLWATALGGDDLDQALGIALDSRGDPWVCGWTASRNFPTKNAYQSHNRGSNDAFLTKLDGSDGSILYSTYLGSSGVDNGLSVAIGQDDRVYICGQTTSLGFPMVNPIQGVLSAESDAFISVFSPDGQTLLFSTYYGAHGYETADALTVDPEGDLVVVGSTDSSDLPVVNAWQPYHAGADDAFVLKLNPQLDTVLFSTYLGGYDEDWPSLSVATDADGDIVFGGSTRSPNFPTTADAAQPEYHSGQMGACGTFGIMYNCEDMFAVKLSPDGQQLVYSTYLGGSRADVCTGIALDAEGRADLVGYTESDDFPQVDQYGADVLVPLLSADGTQLDSVYQMHSDSPNQGSGITVGPDQAVYFTSAVDVPADIFVAKLAPVCVADFDSSGTVDTLDVLAFLNAWNAGESSADVNGDGTVDTQDVLAFLNLWNAGC